jgi:hypothetical protein
MADKTSQPSRDVLHHPFKDIDVRSVEAAIATALGKLLKRKLSVDVQALDFHAGSHRTARMVLTVSVPVDLGLLRGSRASAGGRGQAASPASQKAADDEPAPAE